MTNYEIYKAITGKEPSSDPVEFKTQCEGLYDEAKYILCTPGYDMATLIMAEYVFHNLHVEN